jgi:hypothetical protein
MSNIDTTGCGLPKGKVLAIQGGIALATSGTSTPKDGCGLKAD